MGIRVSNVSYSYQAGTPFEGPALFDIDLDIVEDQYTAIIGHTGSGKSTLLQLLNGLLLPTKGHLQVGTLILEAGRKQKDIKQVRKKIGLVFQFPESQLFEETVLKDVAFGPQNFGISQEEADRIAREKLSMVGIQPEFFERSPFELSGGQMRRVALAGILAMEPEILVLDEPTAGLDPAGRKEFMQLFSDLHAQGIGIILVTHLMDDVANYADYVYLLSKGRLEAQGVPSELFQDVERMERLHLGLPKITRFALALRERGYPFDRLPTTLKEFKEVFHG
ncbi:MULTISPECIES: energy-coupling factor transporter ATPase [unclassified Streptococcus]|uniref:energy-coupling factor transporter ATPase n=1 Tax=unclassified Streptococcus TaxID=2608887 RepID=UPI0018A9C2F3|nr:MULTISPECIES: energy-coupling factor transporter ATPase [unclassified Streptococcus]MBF8970899.1 energy-coupling factor transporter ATPase [Streptococcus sp. NLN76]MBG9367987.1 energy-coupling factor transporter ATPase [Streptococcus sp. NLN64]MBJ6745735.1 energy-coupling factor transporter ATPase [Streptococcus sp. 121]